MASAVSMPLDEYFKLHPTKLKLLVVVVMLATIMQALDNTIANVALPHMQGNMNASQDQISWVLTSYMIVSAIGMALTGYLTARLGRTRLFFLSIVGFTVSSMMCGAAQSLEQMVLFRLLQGLSGACLVPLSQTIMMDVFPREKFGPAMSMWGMGVMLGPIFGPVIGGWLTENYNWRWVFFINAPIGVITAVGLLMLLPETPRNKGHYFDFRGFSFLAIALTSFQLMLDRGETLDWFSSREIVVELFISIVTFYLFIVHIFTTARPFVKPVIYRDANFSVGTILFFMMGMTLFTTMTVLPALLQNLMGYPVIATGIALMPRGIATMIAMGVSGRLIGKLDSRLIVLIGMSLMTIALWDMSYFDLNANMWDFTITGFIQGLGIGLMFPAMNAQAFSTLDPKYRADSTAMFSLVRSMGSSIGISAFVAFIAQHAQINHALLNEFVNPFSRALQGLATESPWRNAPSLVREVNRQASMIAYVDAFRLMAYATLAGMPFLLLMRSGKKEKPSAHDLVVEG